MDERSIASDKISRVFYDILSRTILISFESTPILSWTILILSNAMLIFIYLD